MDHGQLTMVADKFQWVFSEALLNACGKDVQLCRRERVITPLRLGLALTATCASQRVETIADFHCGFHALFGASITASATLYPFSLSHGSSRRTEGRWRSLDTFEDRRKHRPGFLPEKPLRRRRPVRTRAQEVVDCGEACPFPGMVESSQLMVPQREIPVAPFHIGA